MKRQCITGKRATNGRVLYLGNNYNNGINSDDNFNYNARFVGVRQPTGAEGAATRKASPLEELAGKGTQVPGSDIYVVQGPLLQEAIAAFTARK